MEQLVFNEEKRIILMNSTGTAPEIFGDFLDLWGYSLVRVEDRDCWEQGWLESPLSLIIFQFNDFSDKEYQLLAWVKTEAGSLPVVVTSSFISIKECFRMARLGISEYFGQPFNPLDLKKLVEKYTATRTLATTEIT
jgi:response regulator RpfG family c-di-GMP phosphodiesterase